MNSRNVARPPPKTYHPYERNCLPESCPVWVSGLKRGETASSGSESPVLHQSAGQRVDFWLCCQLDVDLVLFFVVCNKCCLQYSLWDFSELRVIAFVTICSCQAKQKRCTHSKMVISLQPSTPRGTSVDRFSVAEPQQLPPGPHKRFSKRKSTAGIIQQLAVFTSL